MNKLEHYKRYLKDRYPNIPQDYNESEGYFYHDFSQFGWQAWQASPKTRPTEPSKITKEQLDAMRADTANIVDHLRGIYAGAASRYPVTPLMMKAADEIEALRGAADEVVKIADRWRGRLPYGLIVPLEGLRIALNKKPAEAG